MVRSSAGREFHDAGREGESPLSELGAQPRCGVAVCLREGERRPERVALEEVGCTMLAR